MLGTSTDRFVQPSSTRFVARDGYTLITTPHCPTYHFGNTIVLHEPPRPEALSRWLDIWRRELAPMPAVTMIVIQWEGPLGASWEETATAIRVPGRAAPLRITHNVIMVMNELARPGGEPPADMRPAESDRDWSQIFELALAQTDPGNQEQADFCRFRFDEYRALVEQGSGQWWCSLRDGTLVGAAGFFWKDDLARFQEVTTHAAYRRRGICGHLVHTAVAQHLARAPGSTVVIAAEPGSTAERIYQRLGFRAVSRQWALAGKR